MYGRWNSYISVLNARIIKSVPLTMEHAVEGWKKNSLAPYSSWIFNDLLFLFREIDGNYRSLQINIIQN